MELLMLEPPLAAPPAAAAPLPAAAAAEAAAAEAAADTAAGCVGASSWLSPLLPLPELSIRKGLRSKRNSYDCPPTTTEAPLTLWVGNLIKSNSRLSSSWIMEM